jgi:hypothetical protein
MLSAMEVIFEVRESESGGYIARAPGHSIVVESDTWDEQRRNTADGWRIVYHQGTIVQDA